MIQGIAHVAFNVVDMEKSLHFYTEVLGFKKAFDIKDDKGNPWIEYIKIGNGQFIELFYCDDKEFLCAPASFSHLCLEVDDIFEITSRLKSHNVPLDVEPVKGKDHNYQCWAKDPDGNRIEFMQIDKRSPQYQVTHES